MTKNRTEKKISVACLGCKKTMTLRKSKVVICDYYTCGSNCKSMPGWKHPATPEGSIRVQTYEAAGSFVGNTLKPATDQENQRSDRARSI